MKVISLFDGISCGQVALNRAGIKVDQYVAFEIEASAIKITQSNFPDTIQGGDVTKADFTQYPADLLIGGSPCQFWSGARAGHGRETTADGLGWSLFQQYVRAKNESGARWFLYENNASIHQNIKDAISDALGVQPIEINSALVSAQNRRRCYWTNIPNVAQPADRGILLSSVLEHGTVDREKSLCLTRRYSDAYGTQAYMCRRYLGKSMGQMVFEGDMDALKNLFKRNDHFSDMDGELTGCRIRQLTPLEAERLQTLPDNYTASEPNRKKRLEAIGNGWTVEVIAHLLSGLAEK